jgi:6-phosphogluconolactonase (cycloisomerase 2 family)
MRRISLVFVGLAIVLSGCTTIVVLSGPRTLTAGDTASYVLSLDGPDGNEVTLYVASDVPADWSLLSNTYTGTVGGVPISSSGTIVPDPYPWLLPPPGDGFQRIWLADGPLTLDPNDSAELTMDFAVNSVPQGEFVLKFWFISSGDPQACSRSYAAVTVNREPRSFDFVRSFDVADGALEENVSATVSPDGSGVVLGGFYDPILSVFDRDELTGGLSHNHVIAAGAGLAALYDITFAPGTDHLYTGETGRMAFFERDPVTGEVVLIQVLQEGVGGVTLLGWVNDVAVSPDGEHVYAADRSANGVAVFDRDPATGELTYLINHVNGSGGVVGLEEPISVALSPDGANLYATSRRADTVVVFDRDPVTGTLGFRQLVANGVGGVAGLDSPRGVVVSADGSRVYTTGFDSNSVTVFDRSGTTGDLSFRQVVSEGVGEVAGILAPTSLAMAPDNRHLFVSGLRSLAIFDRDPTTGELSFRQADYDGEGGVTGISYPYELAVSPDGHDLVYPSLRTFAVFSDRLFTDGFETGGTSAWSNGLW